MKTYDGGRKSEVVEVRENLFQCFIDVRTGLKARLPKALFRLQANKFYKDWLKQNLNTEDEDKLQFSNQWIKEWVQEYGVS